MALYHKIALLIMGLLLIPHAYSQDYFCINNQTKQRSYNISIGDNEFPIVRTELCSWGCDNVTNSCSPNPFDLYKNYGLGLLVLFIALLIIIRLTRS